MVPRKIKIIERQLRHKDVVDLDDEVPFASMYESSEEYEKRINEFLSKFDSHLIKRINVQATFTTVEYIG